MSIYRPSNSLDIELAKRAEEDAKAKARSEEFKAGMARIDALKAKAKPRKALSEAECDLSGIFKDVL